MGILVERRREAGIRVERGRESLLKLQPQQVI